MPNPKDTKQGLHNTAAVLLNAGHAYAEKNDALGALAQLRTAQIAIDRAMRDVVEQLRKNDELVPVASWSDIAGALGVTKQAAAQRYGK